MKATRKRIAAMQTLAAINPQPIKLSRAAMLSNNDLYAALEALGYRWDSATGWTEARTYQRRLSSKSEFVYDDGSPSPIVKVRITAHPELLPILVDIISKAPGISIQTSSEDQPNRAGAGARIYLEALIDADLLPQPAPTTGTRKRARKAESA